MTEENAGKHKYKTNRLHAGLTATLRWSWVKQLHLHLERWLIQKYCCGWMPFLREWKLICPLSQPRLKRCRLTTDAGNLTLLHYTVSGTTFCTLNMHGRWWPNTGSYSWQCNTWCSTSSLKPITTFDNRFIGNCFISVITTFYLMYVNSALIPLVKWH